VTRRRLYFETMMKVLPKVGHKYILDHDQKGILPLLDLSRKGGTP
jgi:membrane protease subunit HflK